MTSLFYSTHVGRSLLEGLQRGSWLSLFHLKPLHSAAGKVQIGRMSYFLRNAGQLSEPLQVLVMINDVFEEHTLLNEPNHCSSLNCSM